MSSIYSHYLIFDAHLLRTRISPTFDLLSFVTMTITKTEKYTGMFGLNILKNIKGKPELPCM